MDKQKLGLVIFWMAVIWALAWGVVGSVSVSSYMNALTSEQLNQTIWALTGPLYLSWAFAVPVGALAAGIGILLYSGAKRSKVWKFGIGVALAIIIGMTSVTLGHFPPLFGIGGTLILLSFFGILWLLARERKKNSISADLKLVGYVFMLIAAWFTCGIASIPFLKALEGMPASSPIHIMIFFVLGWIFLFLGHYKSRKR